MRSQRPRLPVWIIPLVLSALALGAILARGDVVPSAGGRPGPGGSRLMAYTVVVGRDVRLDPTTGADLATGAEPYGDQSSRPDRSERSQGSGWAGCQV